jgi:hypothetical protein
MGKRKVAALEKVEADLATLQYKIRRDPRWVFYLKVQYLLATNTLT